MEVTYGTSPNLTKRFPSPDSKKDAVTSRYSLALWHRSTPPQRQLAIKFEKRLSFSELKVKPVAFAKKYKSLK